MNPILFLFPVWFITCKAASDIQPGTHFYLIRQINGTDESAEDIEREEDLAYPRNDDRILQKVENIWAKYYNCLLEKENVEDKPEIRRLLEGQFVELECDICQRPFEDYEATEWRYRSPIPGPNMSEPQPLDLTSQMKLTKNKSLQIYNVVADIAGVYACYRGMYPVSVYVLEISKNDTLQQASSIQESGSQEVIVDGTIYRAHYIWSKWSDCSKCGRVGKKFRYGNCMVSAKKGTRVPPLPKEVPNEYEDGIVRHIAKGKEVINSKEDKGSLTIISSFKHGIPCSSPHLPKVFYKSFKNLTSVKAIVHYCWVPCEKAEIFKVLDSTGKIVETANNTAGIYSVFQKLPQLPPNVERSSVVAEFGKDIIIQCPGTQLTTVPFMWKVNNKIIFPEIIAKQSNGRLTVDMVSRIHINKVRLKDSHIYSCWQNDKLAGTVHLNVEKKLKLSYDHHLTLFGTAAITVTFLLVGLKIITRELRNRKK